MAESESGQEKTESATPRKREKAREEGQVPKSQEVNTALLMIAGVTAFYLFIDDYWYGLADACQYYLRYCAEVSITEASVYTVILEVALRTLLIAAPFFVIFFIVGVIANLFQVGFLFSAKPLTPKMDKLNPISGMKRIFSARGAMELVKSIGKIFLITPVMIYIVYRDIPEILGLAGMGVLDALVFIGYEALELSLWAILILLILAIIDYIYQRVQHERDLRMTKEEVKQELKDVQGDPQIKGRIRSIQREMARRRMMEEVPGADVVVTNPTEYAIAIKYAPDDLPAPQVIAKGKHLNARRIKELAIECDIPIVENRPLAQSLYKLVDVGGLIPPELYQAVAEVLAYVYRLKNRVENYVQKKAQ
ncbi:MAG: flagellar biosynthesis protein FlhB [Candidatus Omnitrophica bacterium]|nr:flagellar biosynthesis protein FlhB [Candidatus Omnitrophota bacterium]